MKQLKHLATAHRRRLLLIAVFGSLIFAAVSSQAVSDTDVTILKAESVLIESNTVTIVAEATVSVTLTSGDYKPNGKGGGRRPDSQITVKADKATFIIKRHQLNPKDLNGPHAAQLKATQEAFDKFWGWTVEAAKDLQAGKPVGHIGYYGPEIVIKDHLIQSISGTGDLIRKR